MNFSRSFQSNFDFSCMFFRDSLVYGLGIWELSFLCTISRKTWNESLQASIVSIDVSFCSSSTLAIS